MTISLPHSLSLRRLRSGNQKANRQITIDRYTPSRTRKIKKQIGKPRKCRQTSATEISNLLCSRISAGINSVTQNVSSVRNPAPPSLLRQKTSTETADIHRRPDLCNHRRRTPLKTRSPARKWLTHDFVFRRWDLSPSKCHPLVVDLCLWKHTVVGERWCWEGGREREKLSFLWKPLRYFFFLTF